MTDDLVKRLREKAFRAESCEMLETAADRIEELERANSDLANEFTAATSHLRQGADRIEKLENAIKELLSLGEWGLNDLARTVAREALEEKEGA